MFQCADLSTDHFVLFPVLWITQAWNEINNWTECRWQGSFHYQKKLDKNYSHYAFLSTWLNESLLGEVQACNITYEGMQTSRKVSIWDCQSPFSEEVTVFPRKCWQGGLHSACFFGSDMWFFWTGLKTAGFTWNLFLKFTTTLKQRYNRESA